MRTFYSFFLNAYIPSPMNNTITPIVASNPMGIMLCPMLSAINTLSKMMSNTANEPTRTLKANNAAAPTSKREIAEENFILGVF